MDHNGHQRERERDTVADDDVSCSTLSSKFNLVFCSVEYLFISIYIYIILYYSILYYIILFYVILNLLYCIILYYFMLY